MDIGIAGVSILIQQMDHADIKCLCQKHLLIDYQELENKTTGNELKLKFSVTSTRVGTTASKVVDTLQPKGKQSLKPCVIITTTTDIYTKDCKVLLQIKKPFFDRATTDAPTAATATVALAETAHKAARSRFDLGKMLRFLSRYKYSIKQLDLVYTDVEKCLTVKEIQHWCRNNRDYCIGSFVKWSIPELILKNGVLRQIQLESTESKTNYGSINIGQKTGRISVVLHVRKSQKIRYILDDYGNYYQQQQDFGSRSRNLLVSCIDFVTARSKRTRVKAKYQQQKSWESFLGLPCGGKIETINWSSRISVCSVR